LIPELMRYNDLFDLTRGRKKAREREKIYEVFSKIKQASDRQQTNIKDFFFN